MRFNESVVRRREVRPLVRDCASHIKNTLDAAAINVMKPKRSKSKDA